MSERQFLTDQYGNRIGSIETTEDRQTLWDKYGLKLGEYHVRDNVTVDRFGLKVGTGNLLTSLLRP